MTVAPTGAEADMRLQQVTGKEARGNQPPTVYEQLIERLGDKYPHGTSHSSDCLVVGRTDGREHFQDYANSGAEYDYVITPNGAVNILTHGETVSQVEALTAIKGALETPRNSGIFFDLDIRVPGQFKQTRLKVRKLNLTDRRESMFESDTRALKAVLEKAEEYHSKPEHAQAPTVDVDSIMELL